MVWHSDIGLEEGSDGVAVVKKCPGDCCNRRGFSAEKESLCPHHKIAASERVLLLFYLKQNSFASIVPSTRSCFYFSVYTIPIPTSTNNATTTTNAEMIKP